MREQDVEILEQEICYQGFYRLERWRLRHRLFAGGMSPAIVRETIEKGDVRPSRRETSRQSCSTTRSAMKW